MDNLPVEVLSLILGWNMRMCCGDKNAIIELRSVCKAFDAVLKPYLFKTIQLEFSKFLRHERTPSVMALERVGDCCESMYLDMMIIRDEDEIARLHKIFKSLLSKVPEMTPILESLRRHCMSDSTFEQSDFRRVLESVFFQAPRIKRLRLNLPFPVVGSNSRPATVILATSLEVIAKRAEEHEPLETFVLDHVSDTAIIDICQNPMDLVNGIKVFGGLKDLLINVKRQESGSTRQATFTQNLWFLIRKATKLQSLCLIGWNVKRDIDTRKHSHGVSLSSWNMRSLPFLEDPLRRLDNLRFLELKRVDIDPYSLLGIIRQSSHSLKEIYLNEVYLKVHGGDSEGKDNLWIGNPKTTKPLNSCWIAEDLRDMEGLKLDVIRATGLGYDDYAPLDGDSLPDYDLVDPTGQAISFDRRFVGKVFEFTKSSLPVEVISKTCSDDAADERVLESFDSETFQKYHNTTSHYKRSIDGYFFNKNEGGLRELHKIITVADRGMSLLSEEILRARDADIATALGHVRDVADLAAAPGPVDSAYASDEAEVGAGLGLGADQGDL